MIKIKIFRQNDGKVSGFSVNGHSGTAEHGEDIVCAAVSSLAQTALLGVGKHLHRQLDYKVASGDLYMKLKDEPDDLTEAILETMILGLLEIENINPQGVRITEHRR
jgi:uncharacterized protein